MSNYRPEHQPWHDSIPQPCNCEGAWYDRGIIDPSCWHHQAIEVLDFLGLGGWNLYRIDTNAPTSPDSYGVVKFDVGEPYTHVGRLVRVWPQEEQ